MNSTQRTKWIPDVVFAMAASSSANWLLAAFELANTLGNRGAAHPRRVRDDADAASLDLPRFRPYSIGNLAAWTASDRFLRQFGSFMSNKAENILLTFSNPKKNCRTWVRGHGGDGKTALPSNTLILRMAFWRKPNLKNRQKTSTLFFLYVVQLNYGSSP